MRCHLQQGLQGFFRSECQTAGRALVSVSGPEGVGKRRLVADCYRNRQRNATDEPIFNSIGPDSSPEKFSLSKFRTARFAGMHANGGPG